MRFPSNCDTLINLQCGYVRWLIPGLAGASAPGEARDSSERPGFNSMAEN